MEQNTPEWFEHRKKGIGSSDVPVIMGVSPYRTPLQLWEEKTGVRETTFEGNYATERGHNLEGVARQIYSVQTGNNPEPVSLVHPKFPYIRASLDGLDKPTNIVLEIKAPGKADHALAKEGKVPEKYFWQVQHQLLVADSHLAHYWSFDGVEGVLVEVHRDEDAIKKIIEACGKFWTLVQTKESPPMSDKDIQKVKDEKISELVALYRERKESCDNAKILLEVAREELLAAVPKHARIECDGLRVTTSWRKGNVDYKKVPQLKGVDLEPYRAKSSSVVTIRDTNEQRVMEAQS